jgi:hypothetical protein
MIFSPRVLSAVPESTIVSPFVTQFLSQFKVRLITPLGQQQQQQVNTFCYLVTVIGYNGCLTGSIMLRKI